MPTDAVRVTASPSGSANVPVIVAVWPSFTVTAVPFALTYGARCRSGATTSNSEIIPKVAWKKMWQWKTQRPSPPPGVTPSISGRSSSAIRNVSV